MWLCAVRIGAHEGQMFGSHWSWSYGSCLVWMLGTKFGPSAGAVNALAAEHLFSPTHSIMFKFKYIYLFKGFSFIMVRTLKILFYLLEIYPKQVELYVYWFICINSSSRSRRGCEFSGH